MVKVIRTFTPEEEAGFVANPTPFAVRAALPPAPLPITHIHHWLIDPHARDSLHHGICKHCGAERTWPTAPEESNTLGGQAKAKARQRAIALRKRESVSVY